MSGLTVLVFPWPNSIQMYFGTTLDEEDGFGPNEVNQINLDKRFIKCYLREGGLSFEYDFLFDAARPSAKSDLEEIFTVWEASIATGLEALRSARQRYLDEHA